MAEMNIYDATSIRMNINTLKSLLVQNRTEAELVAMTLAEKRQPFSDAIAALEKRYADENFNELLQYKEATESAGDYDRQLREATIQYFHETGEKRLDADCSVRVNTKFEYEIGPAVEWAEKNAPIMIVKSVDKKSFESLPGVGDLEFVHKIESPIAVIAKEFTTI